MRRVVVFLVLGAVLAVACGGGDEDTSSTDAGGGGDVTTEESIPTVLLTSDFEQVCGGGTVSGATEYDKSSGEIHPILAFEGEDPEYDYQSFTLPEGWQSDLLPQETELVVCLDRISETKVNTCEDYEGDEGEEPFDVEVYGATWDVTLYAATTGEEVANAKIAADDKDCPFIVFFDEDEEVQREYADASDQLRGFLQKYVPAK